MPIVSLVFPDTTRPELEMRNVLNAVPVNIAMLKDWNNAKHAHRAESHQIPSRIVALLAKRDSMRTPPVRNANRVQQVNIQRPELWHARIAIQEHLRVYRNLQLAYLVIRVITRPGSVIPNALLAPPVATRRGLRIRGAFFVLKAIINRIRHSQTA